MELTKSPDYLLAEHHYRKFLESLGFDLSFEHLVDTPKRVVRAFTEYFLVGYPKKIQDVIKIQFSEDNYDQMIVVKDIPFVSLCAHHLVPFVGKASVGYLPRDGKITGLSKLARVVEMYARRLQIQERMTSQIAHAVQEALNPIGVGVKVEAEHQCMTLRGIQKPGTMTVTSCLLGAFLEEPETRAEFLSL